MAPLSSLPDGTKIVVLDTSAIIHIGRCGIGDDILKALPNTFLVSDAVEEELRAGPIDHANLITFKSKGLIGTLALNHQGDAVFEQLTIGPGVETLDDGEAATIALAVQEGGYAIVDERKGNRLAQAKFPALERGTCLDVIGHADVFGAVGEAAVADAVYTALIEAKMSVLDHQLGWVVRLIGKDRAAQCPSIAKSRLAAIIKSEGLDS